MKENEQYIDPSECWDLDITISAWIVPRLKLFKENLTSYPDTDGINTSEQWEKAIEKMIVAFELIRDRDEFTYDDKYFKPSFNNELFEKDRKERERKIEEGMLLFAKHIQNLWD